MTLSFRQFLRSEQAAVSTETVIIMPTLIFFYAASFLFFDAFRTYSETLKAANTIADAISRQTNTVTSEDIYGFKDVFRYLTNNGSAWIRVSQIHRSATNSYDLSWSQATGGFPDLAQADINGIEFKLPDMDAGEYIILVETYSIYDVFFDVGIPSQIFENFIVTRPRYASHIPFQDIGCSVSAARCDTGP